MLSRGTDALEEAAAGDWGVPALATDDLEMVQASDVAAEQTDRPVIMLAGSSHFHHAGRSALFAMALPAAETSTAAIRSIRALGHPLSVPFISHRSH